jgi:protein-tyrosine phosphatase
VIDLHNHLLPGVDDGSPSVSHSVRVLAGFAAQGITAVCLTPHLLASEAAAGVPARHDEAFRALQPAAPDEVTLHRGAEVMLDRPLPVEVAADRRVTLGGSRYILVEFPRLITFQAVAAALRRVIETGLVPVLAHPERYACCSPEAVVRWRELGALMQVDATTLLSTRARGGRARALVERGLADILAADNHGDDRSLAAPHAMLVEQDGTAQAQLLTVDNPAAILADAAVTPVPPIELRLALFTRIKRLFDQEEE